MKDKNHMCRMEAVGTNQIAITTPGHAYHGDTATSQTPQITFVNDLNQQVRVEFQRKFMVALTDIFGLSVGTRRCL